mmetsp:Transcript_10793/g.14857  ORF Transcript_10793/g.14857 Transcript_10793/m.14857 type:complete len:249 (-) Transcript_10793:88-834(-)
MDEDEDCRSSPLLGAIPAMGPFFNAADCGRVSALLLRALRALVAPDPAVPANIKPKLWRSLLLGLSLPLLFPVELFFAVPVVDVLLARCCLFGFTLEPPPSPSTEPSTALSPPSTSFSVAATFLEDLDFLLDPFFDFPDTPFPDPLAFSTAFLPVGTVPVTTAPGRDNGAAELPIKVARMLSAVDAGRGIPSSISTPVSPSPVLATALSPAVGVDTSPVRLLFLEPVCFFGVMRAVLLRDVAFDPIKK